MEFVQEALSGIRGSILTQKTEREKAGRGNHRQGDGQVLHSEAARQEDGEEKEPLKKDCFSGMSCRFGTTCRFNHDPRWKAVGDGKGLR
jgi:hypothetical protein